MYSKYDKKLNFTYTKQSNDLDLVSGFYLNKNAPPLITNNGSGLVFPEPQYTKKGDSFGKDLLFVIPEGISSKFAIDTENPAAIHIPHNGYIENYACRIIGLAKKIPGFPLYSSYYMIAQKAQVLMSLEQLIELTTYLRKIDPIIDYNLNNSLSFTKTPDNISKRSLFIKFNKKAPRSVKETLLEEVKNIIDNDNTKAFLIDDVLDATNDATDKLDMFFLIIGLIALILAFFLIWTSFYCNIKDNITEYGIMR
jgi:ABC-type antimicrobial peptide transport system permease subunit